MKTLTREFVRLIDVQFLKTDRLGNPVYTIATKSCGSFFAKFPAVISSLKNYYEGATRLYDLIDERCVLEYVVNERHMNAKRFVIKNIYLAPPSSDGFTDVQEWLDQEARIKECTALAALCPSSVHIQPRYL